MKGASSSYRCAIKGKYGVGQGKETVALVAIYYDSRKGRVDYCKASSHTLQAGSEAYGRGHEAGQGPRGFDPGLIRTKQDRIRTLVSLETLKKVINARSSGKFSKTVVR